MLIKGKFAMLQKHEVLHGGVTASRIDSCSVICNRSFACNNVTIHREKRFDPHKRGSLDAHQTSH